MKIFAVCISPLVFFIAYGQSSNSTDKLWKNLPSDCGRTRFDSTAREDEDDRIINGKEAMLRQFPWAARLGNKYKTGYTFFHCGATLITKYFVASAAHCDEFGNIVRVGQTFEANGTECDKNGVCAPPYQDINIKRYIFEDYCRGTVRNDLMLVELETPAEFNDFVQPLCLPLTSPPLSSLTGQYVITAGWGLQDGTNKKSLSKKLLYIVTPILNPSTCLFQYIYFERNKQFCLDTPSRMTICDGDSGGAAIMFQRRDGVRRAYFIGVVSYQKKFCTFSPVFTSVQYFLDKILSNIDKRQD